MGQWQLLILLSVAWDHVASSNSFTSLSPPPFLFSQLHGLCQLAEHLLEERQPSPCHDGKLQPFLYERGNNVGEKSPLYQEPDCLLITASVSHSRGDQVSLPFFYILEATHCTIKDGPSPPPLFFPFLLFLRRFSNLLWSVRWSCSEKDKLQACCETHFFIRNLRVQREHCWTQPVPLSYFLEFISVLSLEHGYLTVLELTLLRAK